MFTKRMLTMTTAMLAVSASVALAGTKYQANLVTANASNPPGNPTMEKGKISLKDTADIKAQVKGVTDGGGMLVNSSTTFDDTGNVDGTEYVIILKATFTALNLPIERAIPMTMSDGKGKAKISLAGMLTLLPPALGRSVEVTGAEVWGPLGGANVAACQAELTLGYAAPPSACRGGTKIGVAGINVP
jgi:hypothetical protein